MTRMWMAYFQEDGAYRYSITPQPVLEHRAQFEIEKFKKRMTHPEVGLWWVWMEEVPDAETDGPTNTYDVSDVYP